MSYNREYYVSHREKFLEASKKYFAKKRAEKDEEWLEKQNNYMKEYYSKNPDKKEAKNKYNKIYYQTHKDYFKDYYRKKKQLENENKEVNNEN